MGCGSCILNLEKLIFFVDYNHFNMENLNSVRSLVEENYMASADLHDAYFTVNVRPEFRNIFVLFETLNSTNCLPNELTSATRIFT